MKKYDLRTHIKIARIILAEDAIEKATFNIFITALAFMPFAMCIAYFIPGGRILYEKFPYPRFKDFMFVAIPYLIGFVVVNAGTLSITLLAESPKAEGIFENSPQKPRNVVGMSVSGTRGLGTYPLFILIFSSIFRNFSCLSFV